MLILGIILFQSILYFIAKLTPFPYHVVNMPIDEHIPFIPIFVISYVSWYIMLLLIPFMYHKSDQKTYQSYIITLIVSLMISFFIFFFYPTTLIRPNIEVVDIITLIIKLIYFIDTPALNCLPSAHCIIAFLFIFTIIKCKNIHRLTKSLIIIHSLTVVMSTLFIKQHVFVDVLTAFILTLIVYLITNHIVKKSS